MSIFEILFNYKEALFNALLVTVKLCLLIWILGISVGSLLGILSAKFNITIGIPTKVFSFVLTGIPVLVFLFWIHYPLQSIINVNIDPFYTTVFTLSIINIFAVSEVISNSIADFPKQYIYAAKITGLSPIEIIKHIEFPLILRQVIPDILMIQVTMLQSTLFASLISVEEVFRVSQRINAMIYQPIEIYSALAVLFLLICLPLNGLAKLFKKYYTRDIAEK